MRRFSSNTFSRLAAQSRPSRTQVGSALIAGGNLITVTSMKSVEIIYRYGAQTEPLRPRPDDSDAARQRLNEGNRAFAALLDSMAGDEAIVRRVIQVDPRDFGLAGGVRESPKQRPFAAVLGCSDARVPIELIFNEGPNDLFVIRVAGNGLGSEVLGSLKYAVEDWAAASRLLPCWVTAAAVPCPQRLIFSWSRDDIWSSRPVIRSGVSWIGYSLWSGVRNSDAGGVGPDVVHYPGYRSALIEASIVVNAALAAYTVDQELKSQEFSGIKAVYGVYVVESREVWAPIAGQRFGQDLLIRRLISRASQNLEILCSIPTGFR